MPKITFVGAGSTVFARNLLGDIFNYPELAGATICLFDIDPERLRTSEIVARRLASQMGLRPELLVTADRQAAVDEADYVITMFQIAGYRPGTVTDFEVPRRYGLRQTIADTLGIGGIMRGLRTIPVLVDLCREMEARCPQALLLNYVNPMAINCWAASRATSIKTVGLCHSVQGTAGELARDLGIPREEINYLCAGINHMAFYLRFEREGQDLYPRLRQLLAEGRAPAHNRVRYEMLRRLGYFVTESSEHFSEYVPWFIKRGRPDLIEAFSIPLDEYLHRCEVQIKTWDLVQAKIENPDGDHQAALAQLVESAQVTPGMRAHLQHALTSLDRPPTPSKEYGIQIIHSLETGQPRLVYGNVPNHHLIDNLPEGCCVEVPCLVDKNGVQPVRVGPLPPHLAALMQTNINVQALTVEAALTRRREHIYHAAMLDPHTAAELDLDQIWNLVDDLIAAHGGWLPEYSRA